MPQALPLVAQPDLPSQVNAVERDGYVYLPGVLDRDQGRGCASAWSAWSRGPELR